VSILTTADGGVYRYASGTSFSSPITAGVVGLIMSANPELAPAEVGNLLETSADDLGAEGYDSSFGFGRVNAYEALLAATNTPPPPLDTTPPSVAISSPSDGETVSGTINVNVSASDDVGVTDVELYLDGEFLATDTAEPFAFAWDTTQWTDGVHTLEAIAYDAAGNSTTSDAVIVTVDNAVTDTTPPAISIVSPADGATVSKVVRIKVSASDNVEVQRVEVYVDGKMIGTISCETTSCAPTFNWNVKRKKVAKGAHTILARAYDAAGNLGTSSTVTVYKVK
jgi:hypothetical protein